MNWYTNNHYEMNTTTNYRPPFILYMWAMTLEETLNRLIELGWKPRGIDCDEFFISSNIRNIKFHYKGKTEWSDIFSTNDLCSLDSGLWQFLCWLDKKYLPFCSKCNIKIESNNSYIQSESYYEEEVKYRLMVCVIQPDKNKFLLENIVLPSKE